MQIYVDFEGVTRLFEQAHRENRNFLFEYEVYELIRLIGSETVPVYSLIPKVARLDNEHLQAIPGETIVIKVVSPYILHKSDVGGIHIVPKEIKKVLSTVRRMMYEVPEKYAASIEHHQEYAPPVYRGLKGEALTTAISRDIQGVILCQFMPVSQEFGSELIVSLRRTREFGMIISAGLGGIDTELYAERLRKGQAVVAASTEMTDGEMFFRLYQQTISYKVLAGLTRGHQRTLTDEQLLECFSAFIAVGNYFSPLNPDAPFVIEDVEINPFAISDYLMLPLDGLCRFSLPKQQPVPRPVEKIDKLLHPSSIGILGVSAKEANIGRIILQNILANGFDPSRVRIVHPKAQQIEGVAVIPSLDRIEEKVDLLILAVSAEQIPELVTRIIEHDLAENVILVPGGMGEVHGSEQRILEIQHKIQQARSKSGGGPIFVGGNSLGILSHPGRYDSMFIPETLLPKHRGEYLRKSALISQSGGYMITRMSNLSFLDPAYAISVGNQIDLTASDVVKFINTREDIAIIASYMEGFNDLDGLAFAKAVREAVLQGKEVLFYKAGRTPEGKTATSGHTASLAGDYMVCESCVRQAGAMVANTFTSFEGLYRLSNALHHKTVSGNRLAAVSNAGYEAVGMADNILGEDYQLEMTSLTAKTMGKLIQILKGVGLENLVNIKNPMDLTPMANEEVYEEVIRALLKDLHVDVVIAAVVPLTPLIHALPGDVIPEKSLDSEKSITSRISRLAAQFDKPLVIVVDSGSLYDPLADAFQEGGLPVFRSADQAVWVLGKYIQGRLRAQRIIANQK
jgi:acyl-CoA synthetase (NDP forming)